MLVLVYRRSGFFPDFRKATSIGITPRSAETLAFFSRTDETKIVRDGGRARSLNEPEGRRALSQNQALPWREMPGNRSSNFSPSNRRAR